MRAIITSDLHLTDKDRDEYRWGLFPWLKEQIHDNNADMLLFLGDTTDAKDKHDAKLTNRIVETFTKLSKNIEYFYILRGNHDYIDEATPFFKFLNNIKGIQFITEPTPINFIINCLLVPNTRNFDIDFAGYDYIFCHQTFRGAVVENGMPMEGIPPEIFDGWNGKVISGDVHVPQTMNKGKITYVGAPYHIRFNDKFLPRVILLEDNGKIKNLFYKTIKKHTVSLSNPSELDTYKFKTGDQVKIKLLINDISDWEKFKAELTAKCKALHVDLHQIEFVKKDFSLSLQEQESKLKSMSAEEIFESYCKFAKVGKDTKDFGSSILEVIK